MAPPDEIQRKPDLMEFREKCQKNTTIIRVFKPMVKPNCRVYFISFSVIITFLIRPGLSLADDLLFLDNGTVKVGIDREKGAAITWLSSQEHKKNIVNSSDPGRLIQQSYYAGKSIDRRANFALKGPHKLVASTIANSFGPFRATGPGSVCTQGGAALCPGLKCLSPLG